MRHTWSSGSRALVIVLRAACSCRSFACSSQERPLKLPQFVPLVVFRGIHICYILVVPSIQYFELHSPSKSYLLKVRSNYRKTYFLIVALFGLGSKTDKACKMRLDFLCLLAPRCQEAVEQHRHADLSTQMSGMSLCLSVRLSVHSSVCLSLSKTIYISVSLRLRVSVPPS